MCEARCKVRRLANFAKLIGTPGTRHRPPLVWVGVFIGHHIQISGLRHLLFPVCQFIRLRFGTSRHLPHSVRHFKPRHLWKKGLVAKSG